MFFFTNVGTQTVTTNQTQNQTQAYANKGMQERGEHIDISWQMNDAVTVEISMEGMKKLTMIPRLLFTVPSEIIS